MSQALPTPLSVYAGMLWRRKIIILVITLAFTAPALIISMLQPREYQASSALALSAPSVTSDQTVKGSELSDTEMTTQAALLKGDAVRAAAVARGAESGVSTSLAAKSNIMTITASGTTPESAARTTNAYADAFIQLRVEQQQETSDQAARQLQPRIDDLRNQIAAQPDGGVSLLGQLGQLEAQQSRIELQRAVATTSTQVVVRAVPPSEASSPQIVRNTLVGLALGLALGVAVALLSESARQRTASSPVTAGHDAAEAAERPKRDRSGSLDPPTVRSERVGTDRRPAPAPATESARPTHSVQLSSQGVQVGGSGSGPFSHPR